MIDPTQQQIFKLIQTLTGATAQLAMAYLVDHDKLVISRTTIDRIQAELQKAVLLLDDVRTMAAAELPPAGFSAANREQIP